MKLMNLQQEQEHYRLRDINEFKKDCSPKTKLMKSENSDLLADSLSILNRWKNYVSQLLNACRISDIMHMEIYRAEPSVHELVLEVELAVAKLRTYNSPGIDQFRQN
jgi:hypothetical protein